MAAAPGVRIRAMTEDDVDVVLELERRAYPAIDPVHLLTADMVRSLVRVFPDGHGVFERDGRAVGAGLNILVRWDDALAPHTWDSITGEGTGRTHRPDGDTMYGVDVFVDPAERRSGVMTAAWRNRLEFVVARGLRAWAMGSRMPGYADRAAEMAADEYAQRVAKGELHDPTLTPQLNAGMVLRGVLPGYVHDPESRDWAALLTWEPQRPPSPGAPSPS